MKFELEPFNRDVSNEELLSDLRSVTKKLGVKSLTQQTYNEHGRFCAATIKNRIGWNKALIAAGLETSKLQNIDPSSVISDIQRVANELAKSKLKRVHYAMHGKYSASVAERLFGGWKEAVKAAGLEPGFLRVISCDELHENMERVWRILGRQPRKDELMLPLSRFSGATYSNRFGGFRKALEAFVAAVGNAEIECNVSGPEGPIDRPLPKRWRRQTSRSINWRLRFLTLRRDCFRCRACGRSPATQPGVILEVDHRVAWTEGGETVLENLQTLCQQCNGGKSNLDWNAQTK